MPGPAHHDDSTSSSEHRPDRQAHVCLADRLAGRTVRRFDGFAPYGRHRRGDGDERRGAVAAVLDDVLPPALGVRLAGRRGEGTDRIERHRVEMQVPASWDAFAEGPGHRHVDRRHGDVPGVGPTCRLPFRTEVGQRPERRPRHVARQVAEQRHGWAEPVVGHPRQHCGTVRRKLDENGVGSQLVEGTQHGSCRPGAVVADPEEVQPALSRAHGRRRRSRSSRLDRAPPPRGTRAKRSRRGLDRARRRRRSRRRRRPGRARRRRSVWRAPAHW